MFKCYQKEYFQRFFLKLKIKTNLCSNLICRQCQIQQRTFQLPLAELMRLISCKIGGCKFAKIEVGQIFP